MTPEEAMHAAIAATHRTRDRREHSESREILLTLLLASLTLAFLGWMSGLDG